MARSLGKLTVDLALRLGLFETDAGRAANIAEKRAKQIDAAFSKAGAAMGASIAAGAGIAAVAIKNAVDEADNFSKMAAKVGIATDSLSRLDYAAKLSDVSLDGLATGVKKLGQNQLAAMQGGKEYAALFRQLGIEVSSASGGIRDAGGVITDLSDVFAGMKDGADKTALAIKLFGKSGADMIPLLNNGSKALRDFAAKSDEVGYTLSENTGKAAEAFNDQLTEVKLGIDGLWRQALPELLPKLSEFAGILASPDFRDGFAVIINGSVTAVGALLKFATTLANTTKFVGEEIAARVNGPSLDDQVRVAEKLARLRKTEAEFARIQRGGAPRLGNITEMVPGDFLRPVADVRARLQREIADYEKRLQVSQKMGEDAAARAAQLAADAAKAVTVTVPQVNWAAGAGGGSKDIARAQKELRETQQAAKELAEAQKLARGELEEWRAELAGPAAEALLKYTRMEDEAKRKLEAGIYTATEYADALGLIAQKRAQDVALMTPQQKQMEELAQAQKEAAEGYKRSWMGAIDSVSYAFGDFIGGGIRSFKDFGRELVNIARRYLGDVVGQFTRNSIMPAISNWFRQLSSGGFASAGQQGGGFFGQLLQGAGNMLSRIFGGGSASAQAAGTLGGFGNNVGALAGLPGAAMPASGTGAAGLAMNPWLGALGGAAYGFSAGGDAPGKLLGGAAYGIAGYGLMAGVGGAMAGGVAGSLAAGIASVPVAGWIALGAIAIDKISGGKLFGTKYKMDSAAREISIADDGASGFTSTTQVKQRSLFRGRKWKTTTTALDGEAQAQINELFDAVMGAVGDAAAMLGVEAPALVAGTFRQEFDKNGNLKKEFATIAGQVYNEGQEAFAARLLGENLLAVAKVPGGAEEIERLAGDYRTSGETLQGFATLMLAVQSDIKNATQLWTASGEGVMTSVVQAMERLAKGGEELVETYQRVTGVAREYGQLIGGVESQLLTNGLNEYQRAQLDIEMGYRAQVKQANELAKSLGLTGARAEDLAKIEQLRAVNMASLQKQMEAQKNTFLQDLGLSDLSPLRDSEKLAESMQLLRDAAGAGDMQRAQQLSQQVLGFGRNLYASGADYNALYGQVTGLLNGMSPGTLEGFTETGLDNIADILEGLPDKFAQAIFQQAANITPLPVPPTTPTTPPPGGTTQPGNGGDDLRLLLQELRAIRSDIAAASSTMQLDSLRAAFN